MATLDDLDPESRDSLMILSYLLVQVQRLNWTADNLADGLDDALDVEGPEGESPGSLTEPVGTMIEALGDSESYLLGLARMQVLRRALLVWASQWEDDDGGPELGAVRDLAQTMLEDDRRNYMRSLLTLVKGGRED